MKRIIIALVLIGLLFMVGCNDNQPSDTKEKREQWFVGTCLVNGEKVIYIVDETFSEDINGVIIDYNNCNEIIDFRSSGDSKSITLI